MRRQVIICATLCASACAAPSQRIASELTRAGLDPLRAQCIGSRLQHDLSIAQLQQLGNAARSLRTGGSAGPVTAADLVRASAQIQDAAVPIAVAAAVGACA